MKVKLVKTQKLFLFVAGVILIVIGMAISTAPLDFYATNGIDLGANVSLLNELKAPAGFLLVAGLFMLGGVFVKQLSDTALSLATLIYLSYAASRFSSMLFDGVPASGLVQAAILETSIGLACLALLILRRAPVRLFK